MPTKIEKDAVTGQETTGHEWDGIKELNTPLPRWWLYTFYATIAFAAVYAVLYPSIPGFRSHSGGVLGYTQRTALDRSVADAAAAQKVFRDRISASSLADVQKDPELFGFAMTGGRAAFNENCAACHKAGGAGGKGFPNLADDDWLWGGTLADVSQTVTHGIRNTDPNSRQSMMPRFGADGLLTAAQIGDVADYVISLSDRNAAASGDASAVGRGGKLFADNCASCHGAAGEGNREVGAPRLNDRIWLYGGDKASVVQTITFARNGSMPAWGERLDPVTIKMLTVYVHALGGGE